MRKSKVLSKVFWVQALFWQQQNYYGVDLTPLYGSAFQGYFSQVYNSCIFLKYVKVLFPVLVAFNKLFLSLNVWKCILNDLMRYCSACVWVGPWEVVLK